MVYYFGILFSVFGIFIIIFVIRQIIVYKAYFKLKLREDPLFDKNKYQYSYDSFVISVFPIKENDKNPILIKLKEKYNFWIKLWWYSIALLLCFSGIGMIFNLILN